MDQGALDHPLETRRRLGVGLRVDDEIGELLVEAAHQLLAQAIDLDATGAHDGDRVAVLGERQQQMLERHEFVPPLVGECQRSVQRLLQISRKSRHSILRRLFLLHRTL